MGKNIIRSILLFSMVFLALNIKGCTDEKKAFNQTVILTDDVKADTEPELKVISTEIIPFNNDRYVFGNVFIEKDNGSTLIRDYDVYENLENSIIVKIDGNKAICEYVESIGMEYKELDKSFYSMSLGNNNTLITDWFTDNKFNVEEELVNNEKSRYEVSGEYLVELFNESGNGTENCNLHKDSVTWTNLNSGSDGTIKIPGELQTVLYNSIVGDRLFLATVSVLEVADHYINLEEGAYTLELLADTLLVVDLTTNKLIENLSIGRFKDFKAIDDERIILTLDKENEEVVKMYNLNNKTNKELMRYSKALGDGLIKLNGLNIFPSRDKVYYCEDDGQKLSLKIAEINGMDIENIITAYEIDKNTSENFEISNITISKDERDIKIFNKKLSEYGYFIDKIIKIKLSK